MKIPANFRDRLFTRIPGECYATNQKQEAIATDGSLRIGYIGGRAAIWSAEKPQLDPGDPYYVAPASYDFWVANDGYFLKAANRWICKPAENPLFTLPPEYTAMQNATRLATALGGMPEDPVDPADVIDPWEMV